MTEYIKNPLIKLCDHPEKPHTAIRNYLSHVQLNDFIGRTDSEIISEICSVDRIPLANFLNEDQGYEKGISMYGHYIACKCLDIDITIIDIISLP